MKATPVLFMLACCMGGQELPRDPRLSRDPRLGPDWRALLEASVKSKNQETGCVWHPIVIHKEEPQYPGDARRGKIQGDEVLQFEVDPSGRVVNVQVVHSLGLAFDKKALKAIRKSQFQAGVDKDGKPVSCAEAAAATIQDLVAVRLREKR